MVTLCWATERAMPARNAVSPARAPDDRSSPTSGIFTEPEVMLTMPLVGLDLSSGARAGLTAFLAGIARSVAQHNVTINFLLPGPFDTDRLRSNHEVQAKKQGITVEQALAHRIATIPARRLGTADEFGATCAFLCSAHAGFITGQNVLLDGGIFPGAF